MEEKITTEVEPGICGACNKRTFEDGRCTFCGNT